MFKHYKYNVYIALQYTVNKSGAWTSTYYDWEWNSYKCKLIPEFPDSDPDTKSVVAIGDVISWNDDKQISVKLQK